MVNDADDGEIAGIGLASCRLTGCRTADADHPVPRFGPNGVNGNLLGAPVLHNLKVLVLKIRNPVGGDKRLDDLDNEHDQ